MKVKYQKCYKVYDQQICDQGPAGLEQGHQGYQCHQGYLGHHGHHAICSKQGIVYLKLFRYIAQSPSGFASVTCNDLDLVTLVKVIKVKHGCVITCVHC